VAGAEHRYITDFQLLDPAPSLLFFATGISPVGWYFARLAAASFPHSGEEVPLAESSCRAILQVGSIF